VTSDEARVQVETSVAWVLHECLCTCYGPGQCTKPSKGLRDAAGVVLEHLAEHGLLADPVGRQRLIPDLTELTPTT
jgi:hypothetical protein